MEDKIKDDKELNEKLWELRKLVYEIGSYLDKKLKNE